MPPYLHQIKCLGKFDDVVLGFGPQFPLDVSPVGMQRLFRDENPVTGFAGGFSGRDVLKQFLFAFGQRREALVIVFEHQVFRHQAFGLFREVVVGVQLQREGQEQ